MGKQYEVGPFAKKDHGYGILSFRAQSTLIPNIVKHLLKSYEVPPLILTESFAKPYISMVFIKKSIDISPSKGGTMKRIGVIALLATISLAIPAGAEFYRYLDQHGNVIYTDDLSRVPIDQRTGAETIGDSSPITHGETAAKGPNSSIGARQGDHKASLRRERIQLDEIKRELDSEFQRLADENARLKAEQKTAVTPDQIKAVNKKAVSFNARFQAYQEKEAAYKSRLEAYNKRANEIYKKSPN